MNLSVKGSKKTSEGDRIKWGIGSGYHNLHRCSMSLLGIGKREGLFVERDECLHRVMQHNLGMKKLDHVCGENYFSRP